MRSPNLQRALLQKHCFCKTNSKNDFAPQPRRDARSEPIILKSIGKITDALTRQASKSKRFLGKQSSRQAALAGSIKLRRQWPPSAFVGLQICRFGAKSYAVLAAPSFSDALRRSSTRSVSSHGASMSWRPKWP